MIERKLHPSAGPTTGNPSDPVRRRLFNDPILVKGRIIADAARANEGPKKLPASDDCTICTPDGVCKPCKPATLTESDLQGLSKDDLYRQFQDNAKYSDITIPTHHLPMIQNFEGWLKMNYSDDAILEKGDLNNLVLITQAIRNI